jgi:lipid-A-disaccharide synthase-like uncharacterized protein
MSPEELEAFPYTAISVSILARFIFLYLLYKNKSRNNYSLVFCLLNIGSSSLWLVYSIYQHDMAMISRSGTEIALLAVSTIYIIRNKFHDQVAPSTHINNASAKSSCFACADHHASLSVDPAALSSPSTR